MKLTDKLLELNIDIPKATPALGSYVPYKIIEEFIYISGQLPIKKNEAIAENLKTGTLVSGKVPSSISIDQAKKAAELCILNTMPLLVMASNDATFNNKSDVLVIDPRSDFFKYLNKSKGNN